MTNICGRAIHCFILKGPVAVFFSNVSEGQSRLVEGARSETRDPT